MEKQGGKISDRIRGELADKVDINPERGQEKAPAKPMDHNGYPMTGRKKK